MPVASRAYLQMDQETLTNKGFLWYKQKRSKNSNLDCYLSLLTDSYSNKKAKIAGFEPLHNSTGFEWPPFLKRIIITVTYSPEIQTYHATIL